MAYLRGQTDRRGRTLMHPYKFHQEIERLTRLLELERGKTMEERHKVSELGRELDYTRSELKRQKTLKEMFINREKEAKKELERLWRFSNPETLSTAKLASQVQSTIKQKKKKLLQKDYEELQVAYMVQQETLAADLQMRQRNKALQEELDGLRSSHQELRSKYLAEILAARMETQTLQEELDRQIKSHADRMSKDLQTINRLRAEQHALHQRLAEEQQAEKDYVGLQREVEKLTFLLNQKMSANTELPAEVQEREERWSPCRKKRRLQQTDELNLQPVQPQRPQQQQEQESILAMLQREERQEQEAISVLLNDGEALEDDEALETFAPEEKKKAPLWKRTRHFLGLRKPKAWKHDK